MWQEIIEISELSHDKQNGRYHSSDHEVYLLHS